MPISSWRCSPCESEPTSDRSRPSRPTPRELARAIAELGVALRPHGPEVAALTPRSRQVQVVLDRQAEERAGLLVRAPHAELRAQPRRQRPDLLPEQLDRARPRRDVARDDVEQRGLPGAVRAEDGAPLAGRDVEVDVAHGDEAAVAPADPPQAEDRRGALADSGGGHLLARR